MDSTVKCQVCNGSGTITLDETLFRTLEALKALGKGCPGDVWRSLPDKVGATAINNRMEKLLALKLVKRTKVRKAWIYEPLTTDAVSHTDQS